MLWSELSDKQKEHFISLVGSIVDEYEVEEEDE